MSGATSLLWWLCRCQVRDCLFVKWGHPLRSQLATISGGRPPIHRPGDAVGSLQLGPNIPDKAKVNGKLYCEILLPRLLQVAFAIWFHFPAGRSTCSHGEAGSKLDCHQLQCFIGKDEWPPNSPDLNPLDYHVWGAMLERYKTFQPKPNTIDELKKVLQTIWDDLPQNSINEAILSFVKKTSSLCESLGRTLWTRLEINCFCRVLNC